jgi:hypothetical protein
VKYLSLHGSVLRTFERNRNVALGGSEGLRRIQEDGVFVVVVGFADVCMDLTQVPIASTDQRHHVTCYFC